LRSDARLSDVGHAAGVAVPAVEDHGDVDVEDVARGQHLPLVGDAVADDVVDRGANALGEAAIAERRRYRAMADDEVVAQPVELAGGGAGAHMWADEIERGRGQMPGPAHAFQLARVVQVNLLRPPSAAAGYCRRTTW